MGHNTYSQEVHLKIYNIHSATGVMCVGVFDSEENFRDEKPYLHMIVKKTTMENNEMALELKLKPGTYGITVLDDENSDGKMNWKLLAIPREGFGFADYYHTGLKKPRFHKFSFTFLPDQKKCMIVKMRYF